MQKRDVVEGGKVSNKNIGAMKCGECLHFATSPHSSKKGEVCSKIGIRAEGTAPACFTPNVKELAVSSDFMMMVTTLMSTMSKTQRRILAATMMSKRTKKQVLKFGTKIYFRPMGKDYLSNYRSGFVMGYSSTGDLMVIGDPDPNKRGSSYVALLKDDEATLTSEQWKIKRAELTDANMINDPEIGKSLAKRTSLDNYEPPSMDTAPEHWFSKTKAPEKKKKRGVQEVTG